jgi:hypothetical protein
MGCLGTRRVTLCATSAFNKRWLLSHIVSVKQGIPGFDLRPMIGERRPDLIVVVNRSQSCMGGISG